MKGMLDVKLWMHLLEIEITTKCNLKCKHCYNRGNPNCDMPIDDIIKYIEFANNNEIGKVVISGGEACLHKDFKQLLLYLKNNRKFLKNIKKIVLQSNGLIGKYNLDDFKGFDMIHLSFDIDDNEVRETDSNYILNLANDIKRHGINCYLFSTIHKNNIKYIDDIVKMANDSGNQISFNLCCDTGKNKEYLLTKEEKIFAIKKLLEYEKDGRINKLKHPYVNSFKEMSITEDKYHVMGGCSAGIATATILANGDVIPCPFLRLVVGNIHEKPLEEIWFNSEILNKIRNRKNYQFCGKCKYIAYCGGCRKSAYQFTGKVDSYDYNCILGDKMIEIREANYNDINDIVNIKISGWKAAYKGILDDEFLESMSYEENYQNFKKEISDKDSLKKNFVILLDNKVIGYSKVSLLTNEEFDCQIYAIYIDPNLKNKGYGTMLLDYIKNYFKNLGCKKMILWCIDDNIEGKRFYTRKNGREHKKIMSQIGSQSICEVSYIFDIE